MTRNLSELRTLTDDKRCHAMKALSALAKYLGLYDDFKQLVHNYGLKWGGKSADDIIIARLTKNVRGDEIYVWMRTIKVEFPEWKDFIDFMATTGLRYVEAVESWNLIRQLARAGQLSEYYKVEKQVLEHFRHKELFIRKSKKAFISFVSKDLVDRVAQGQRLSMDLLPTRIKRKGLKRRFGDIRELHGSLLTKHLSQPEIDFIHGRISTNVFMRNYFNPAWISDLQTRTLKATAEIVAQIS
nr:hypothetical protein [Candidatus Njordarchaeum guaymaensis]